MQILISLFDYVLATKDSGYNSGYIHIQGVGAINFHYDERDWNDARHICINEGGTDNFRNHHFTIIVCCTLR